MKSWLYSRRKGRRSIDSRFIIPTISFVGTILDYSVPIKMGSPDAYENPARATSFVRELRDKTNILCDHLPGQPGRVYGTRELVLHKHCVAVYRVQGDELHVLTLFHTAQQR